MKPIENRKHHYVPQFLLRNFALEHRDTLYAFDKWELRQFSIAIKDAAAERGYNSFKTESMSGCAEFFFTQIETMASPVIQDIVEKRRLPSLSIKEKAALVQFAVAQMVRSKNHRAKFAQLGDIVRQMAHEGGTPELQEWVGKKDPAQEKQSLIVNVKRDISYFTPAFVNKDIMLFSSTEDRPFLIGDSPITRTNSLNKSKFHGTLGLLSEGMQIYLPLSPTLTIGFMCRSVRRLMEEEIRFKGRRADAIAFDYLLSLENPRTLSLTPPNVDFLNSLQITAAERFVYSRSEDFALVRDLIANSPENRIGHRLTSNLADLNF